MPRIRSFLHPLFAFVADRFSSLSTGIIIAMCAGLLLPALIGGLTLTNLNEVRMNQELQSNLDDKLSLVANSLANPVWNYDTNAAAAIADAALLDPQVVRITITVGDAEPSPFLNIERPERKLGKTQVARHKLTLSGEVIGTVEMEIDNGLRKLVFMQDRYTYSGVLLGQFIFALTLILLAVRFWVLKPLARLSAFSTRLASGDLEHPIEWKQSDEIGRLAEQLDQMRGNLLTSFAEQQAILNNVQVGVIFVREHRIQLANRHAEQIFGYGPGEMHGLPAKALYLSDDQFSAIHDRASAAISPIGGRYEDELRLQRRNGCVFWARMQGCALDHSTPDAGSIWVYDDITERKATENEIISLAFYDPLTRLPNRRLLVDRLKQALIASARSGNHGALLFIDLDNFKTLNDTLGHDVGDLLLQQVGDRLNTCARETDTVARLGGDEFVVMLENLGINGEEAAAQARVISEKIIDILNRPYQLAGHEQISTPSIGITLFGERGNKENPLDGLFKQADLALYQAKACGRNTLRFFDPEMQAVVIARAALEASLREAVATGQFILYYQAQVDHKGVISGVEALVRWQHPQRGIVLPAEFIPLAEDTGLVLPLGNWVLRTACAQLAAWASHLEMSHLSIAVNVSARQIRRHDFVEQVLTILDLTGANPNRLKLELTESLLVDDVEDTIAKMSALKTKGVSFSLDDFGTGYSSLSYLKRLPLAQLKIDQSFVRDILTDSNDASIAKMVVVLAESLGLSVIAEGVETEEQKDFLARQGCYAYQGCLFGRPLPVEELEANLTRRTPMYE